jgi:LAO/AO transport system kinase
MLDAYTRQSGWRPPILTTNTLTNEGIDKLFEEIIRHKNHMELAGLLEKKRRDRINRRMEEILDLIAKRYVAEKISDISNFEAIIDSICAKEIDIYSAAEKIADKIF